MPNMNYSDMRTIADQFRRGAGMNRTFKRGDRNSLVYLLQSALYHNGYNLHLNGDFDDATEAAVRAYQRDNGFAEDGIMRPDMLSLLFPADLPATGTMPPAPPPAPMPLPAPMPRPIPLPGAAAANQARPRPAEYTIRLDGRTHEAIIRVSCDRF